MTRSVDYRDGKGDLQRIPKTGETMGTCATYSSKYICCHVHVVGSVQNCPFECSYCFLQNYLNDGMTKAINDIDAVMHEVRAKIGKEPWRLFRIGTWEVGDSLALEEQTGQATRLIREFAGLHNAVLELKTKSDRVVPILRIDHKGKTVVSWSLNTDHIITTEEHRTASLVKRLHAMRSVSDAGYLIGLHFDPMIFYEGWEKDYELLAERVFHAAPLERIAWISIGSLRFNPEMKKKIENNYPSNRMTCAEMVLGDDGKMRYVKPLRVRMYQHMYGIIRKHISTDILVYLCMERWDVWEKVFGWRPDSAGHLDYLIADSLYRRFGLHTEPVRELYEKDDI